MKKIIVVVLFCFLNSICFASISPWGIIENTLKKKGTVNGDVLKITFPRPNLAVTIENVSLSPGLALTSWLAFKRTVKGTLMTGELVLQEEEIPRVQYKLDSAGIRITALQNHLTGETPKLMYMNIRAQGDPRKLALVMKSIFIITQTPLGETALSRTPSFNWAEIDSILGIKGTINGNEIQFTIPRPDKIMEDGVEFPPFMGTASTINFQPTDIRVIVSGYFVLLANEVAPVTRTLTSYSIGITAQYSQSTNESPRIVFLHFLGFDDAGHLADGIKAALDNIGKVKKSGKSKSQKE
jgi:hypothetical protein